jgi:hydrogenase-4 component F
MLENDFRDSALTVGPIIAFLALVLLLGIYIPPPVSGLLHEAASFVEGRP